MFLNWNDATWKDAINITYFKVQIRKEQESIILPKNYVNASSNVSDWLYTALSMLKAAPFLIN
jgi:hypothetical protein